MFRVHAFGYRKGPSDAFVLLHHCSARVILGVARCIICWFGSFYIAAEVDLMYEFCFLVLCEYHVCCGWVIGWCHSVPLCRVYLSTELVVGSEYLGGWYGVPWVSTTISRGVSYSQGAVEWAGVLC